MSPAQVLIYYKLHYAASQGTPLSDLQLEPGDKVVEYVEHGKVKARKVTQSEEVNFLRKEISGVIKGARAFESVFGTAATIRLPETFEEIEDVIGKVKPAPAENEAPAGTAPVPDASAPHVEDWNETLEDELTELVTKYKKTDDEKKRLKELQAIKASANNLKRS